MNKVFTQIFGFAEFCYMVDKSPQLKQPSEATQLFTNAECQ